MSLEFKDVPTKYTVRCGFESELVQLEISANLEAVTSCKFDPKLNNFPKVEITNDFFINIGKNKYLISPGNYISISHLGEPESCSAFNVISLGVHDKSTDERYNVRIRSRKNKIKITVHRAGGGNYSSCAGLSIE